MATEITVAIADDHPIVRQGLRQVIESDRSLKVVAEAGDGRTALEQIEALRPDVAILDIDMPEMDGFEVARALAERRLQVEVVFLTIHRDEDLFNEAIDLGAKGYVLKDSALTDITGSIKAAAAGQHYTSPSMSSYLIRRSSRAVRLATHKPGLNDLTPTELRILKLIAQYKTSREIADEMCISPRTVDTHRTNICNKLDLHGSHALMKFALAHKSDL
ncbi:MAG: response regulator transcription factor [Acidobacteriota bacterium]